MALWTLIGLLLARGLGDVVSGGDRVASAPAPPAAAFPDENARAFTAAFARVYVGGAGARALAPYLAPGLAEQLRAGQRRRTADVAQVTPAGEQPLGPGRALITVACQLGGGQPLYLAVPVVRDAAGGLAVSGLPAFVAPPSLAVTGAEQAQPVAGSEADQIRALAGRFLAAYLAAPGSADLAYLLAPGASIQAAGGAVRLVEVTDVGQLGGGEEASRTLLVQARAREVSSGATYPVAYRLEVVRRDRWYVSAVQGALR